MPAQEGQERTGYYEPASGLRLRVTRRGARTWVVLFWSRSGGRTRRLTLGNATEMPLKKAREAARAALVAVDGEGRDPLQSTNLGGVGNGGDYFDLKATLRR